MIYLFCNPLSQMLEIDKALVLLFIPRSIGTTFVSFLTTHLIIENKTVKNLLVNLSISLSSIGLSLLMAFNIPAFQGKLYYAFIIGNTIPSFMVGIAVIIWGFSRGKSFIKRTYWRYCLGISLPLVFHSLAGLILAQSDHIMLQQMYSLESAGTYGFTYNIASVVSMIWSATNAVWVPFYFRNLKENDTAGALTHAKRFSELFLIICFGFVMVYPEVVRVLATPEYCKNFNIVPLVIIAYLFMHIYSFPANYEFYKKQTKWTAIGSLLAAVVNIVLNYIFIPQYGQTGAAVATALSYFMLFVFHEMIARYVIGAYPIPRRFACIQILLACLIAVSYYMLQDIWTIRWMLASAAGIYAVIRIYKRKAII